MIIHTASSPIPLTAYKNRQFSCRWMLFCSFVDIVQVRLLILRIPYNHHVSKLFKTLRSFRAAKSCFLFIHVSVAVIDVGAAGAVTDLSRTRKNSPLSRQFVRSLNWQSLCLNPPLYPFSKKNHKSGDFRNIPFNVKMFLCIKIRLTSIYGVVVKMWYID